MELKAKITHFRQVSIFILIGIFIGVSVPFLNVYSIPLMGIPLILHLFLKDFKLLYLNIGVVLLILPVFYQLEISGKYVTFTLVDFSIITGILMLFLYMLKRKVKIQFEIKLMLSFIWITLFLVFLVNLFEQNNPLFNFFNWIKWFRFPLLMIIVYVIYERKYLNMMLNYMAVATLFVSLTILYTAISVQGLTILNSRLVARFFSDEWIWGWPNYYAAFHTFLVIFSLCLLKGTANKYIKVILYTNILLGLFIIVFSFSRSSYVSLLIGFVVVAIYRKRKMLMTLGLICIIFFMPSVIKDRLMYTFSGNNGTGLDSSSEARLYISKYGLIKGMEAPFFGNGYTSTSTVLGNSDILYDLGSFHNQYVDIFNKAGIVGLILFLIIISRLIFIATKLMKKGSDEKVKALALGMLAGVASLMISSLTQENFNYELTSAIFWFLSGVLIKEYYFGGKRKSVDE